MIGVDCDRRARLSAFSPVTAKLQGVPTVSPTFNVNVQPQPPRTQGQRRVQLILPPLDSRRTFRTRRRTVVPASRRIDSLFRCTPVTSAGPPDNSGALRVQFILPDFRPRRTAEPSTNIHLDPTHHSFSHQPQPQRLWLGTS